ncbi:fungal specific transcription factor [Purpureocillium lavendulum]|uniref:Fungal specific transcription factor n=1 Tax=Purpureocillium lavendulum TaxID=1247861 RepID=A0AB34FUG4_9HYPO|nr:fungal specific transcription factor [Purpureocillium lavendulum]
MSERKTSPIASSEVVSGCDSMEKSAHITHGDGADNGHLCPTSTAGELHRDMSIKTLFMLGIGGGVGTALFVSIGGALNSAGPGGLLLGFIIYSIVIANINNSMAEMSTYMPVSGSFIRLAGYWVDDALGFAGGWNFYMYLGLIVPFEITALSLVLSYWSPHIPAGAISAACIVLYFLINIFAVRIYGHAEFGLCMGKALLMIILMMFTLVTMCGGNPQHDAFGFRNWKSPGPFLEYFSTGATGRFEGFLTALWFASFTCVGPEFLSIAAPEVRHPRAYVKKASKALFVRIIIFYIGGALAVSIILSPDNKVLNEIYKQGSGGAGTAAASPYIIAMQNLGITGLPHIITALFATTIFAAGNTCLYSAIRCLYGLSLEGRAPKFLLKVTKSGVPVYCSLVTMIFPLLSLLQLGSGTATVLAWLINLATGATLIYFMTALITYIRFHRACEVQGLNREELPYKGWFQPYSAWFALIFELVILVCYGYRSLVPFNVSGFVTAYFMPLFVPCLFIGWKVIKKTKFVRARDMDLVWEAPLIDAYEALLEDAPVGFWKDFDRQCSSNNMESLVYYGCSREVTAGSRDLNIKHYSTWERSLGELKQTKLSLESTG